jgi:hypothetical protein
MPLNVNGNIISSAGTKYFNYKNIVTTNLICYVDAANSNSYGGSGSTWYDLIGNGNNFSFVSSPSWSLTTGGVMVTTGTGGQFQCDTIDLRSSNFTVIAGSKYSSGSGRGRIVSGHNNNWLLGHWGNAVANYYSAGWITSSGAGGTDTNWRIYAGTGVIGGTYKFYINGVLNSSGTGGTAGPYGFAIGAYGPSNTEFSDGNVSFLLVYNRELTAAEITQNYQVFRNRLGV